MFTTVWFCDSPTFQDGNHPNIINSRMDTEIMAQSHNGLLLGDEDEHLQPHSESWRNLTMLSKRTRYKRRLTAFIWNTEHADLDCGVRNKIRGNTGEVRTGSGHDRVLRGAETSLLLPQGAGLMDVVHAWKAIQKRVENEERGREEKTTHWALWYRPHLLLHLFFHRWHLYC